MSGAEREIVKQRIRRAVTISALQKIGLIVDEDLQTEDQKARMLRWFARYGWIVLPCIALLLAYLMGSI